MAQAKREQEAKEKAAKHDSIMIELTGAAGLTVFLADLLIDMVRVYPGNRIEIEYMIPSLNREKLKSQAIQR